MANVRPLLDRLNTNMKVPCALIDDPTLDDATTIRLLNAKILNECAELARIIFTSVGGRIPDGRVPAPHPVLEHLPNVARNIWLRHMLLGIVENCEARDPFATNYLELSESLKRTVHLVKDVQAGQHRTNARTDKQLQSMYRLVECYRTFYADVDAKLQC